MAASVAALVAILLGTTASASAAGTAETRVRASGQPAAVLVGPPEHISAGQRLGNDGPRVVVVVATGVAANTAGRACRTNSFTGETLVLMADGTRKPIKHVKLGDKVIATDPITGKTGPRKVIDLIRHGGLHTMVAVRLANGLTIDGTDRHPFWVESRGAWVDAIDLRAGDVLVTADGDRVAVVSLGISEQNLRAYNLTVEGLHTYHVGEPEVLVHNCINWAANSVKTFGHTFNTHGAGPKNLRNLTGRARGTGDPQGQWLDNDAAADFLRGVHIPDAGSYSVRLPEGLGQVILPDGSIAQARAATIIPNPNGVIRTAYPIIGGP